MDIASFALDHAFQNPRASFQLTLPNETLQNGVFGVFVSLERSLQHRQRAGTDLVHGCIGNWSNDFRPWSSSEITNTIAKVAYEACWEDSRRNYFEESIYTDVGASCKVYFMLTGVQKVDIASGRLLSSQDIYFNNDYYGLIVGDGNRRATYLPGVFPGISQKKDGWQTIVSSLFEKAGISSPNEKKLYAYTCSIYKIKIWDYYVDSIHASFERFYYFSDFIPYAISQKGEIEIDKSQSVRNIATIYDFDLLQKYYKPYHTVVQQKMKKDIAYYVDLYQKNGYNQSSLFLLLYLYHHGEHKYIQRSIIEKMKENFWKMEPEFEQGEALYVLSQIGEADEIFYQIFDRYTHAPPLSFDYSIQDIFRLNWHVKSLDKKEHLSILLLLQEIVYRILQKECTIPTSVQKWETNYIAVSLECISTIKNLLKGDHYKNFNDIYGVLCRELARRKFSFFVFLDGTARLDITGHVLQAYYRFLEGIF